MWASPAVPSEKRELPPPVLPPQGMAARGQEQQNLGPTWPWQPLLVSSSCAKIPSFLLQVFRTDFAGQKGRYLWTNRVGDRGRSSHAAILENIWRIYDLNSFYVVHVLYVVISVLAIAIL